MCSTCGSTPYGQEQPEERAKDVERLKRVSQARKSKKILVEKG